MAILVERKGISRVTSMHEFTHTLKKQGYQIVADLDKKNPDLKSVDPVEVEAEPIVAAESDERTALMAELDKRGIKYHANAGVARLKNLLDGAK